MRNTQLAYVYCETKSVSQIYFCCTHIQNLRNAQQMALLTTALFRRVHTYDKLQQHRGGRVILSCLLYTVSVSQIYCCCTHIKNLRPIDVIAYRGLVQESTHVRPGTPRSTSNAQLPLVHCERQPNLFFLCPHSKLTKCPIDGFAYHGLVQESTHVRPATARSTRGRTCVGRTSHPFDLRLLLVFFLYCMLYSKCTELDTISIHFMLLVCSNNLQRFDRMQQYIYVYIPLSKSSKMFILNVKKCTANL